MGPEEAVDHARRLRKARAEVMKDGEAYVKVAIAVEHMAAALGVPGGGMGKGECRIKNGLGLEDEWGRRKDGGLTLRCVYNRIREARNIAVHEGAVSRAVGRHAIELSMRLEEALMKIGGCDEVQAWMAPDPEQAHAWMTVGQVRSRLVSGGFSDLPIRYDGEWHLLSDVDVVLYLEGEGGTGDRVEDAVKKERTKLQIRKARIKVRPDAKVGEVGRKGWNERQPVLVVREGEEEELVGILTPHDLLMRGKG